MLPQQKISSNIPQDNWQPLQYNFLSAPCFLIFSVLENVQLFMADGKSWYFMLCLPLFPLTAINFYYLLNTNHSGNI